MGAPLADAAVLHRLHSIYFGPTAFTAKQREAAQTTHSLTVLRQIEGYVGRLRTQKDAWDLRVLLCNTPAGDVRRVARERLKAVRGAGPEAGVRVTRRAEGNHTLTITDSSLRIADMLGVLKATDSEDLLKAARSVFGGSGAASVPTVHTNVIVRLDELDRIVDGDGEEIRLQLTNGATMTGGELVRRRLSELGYITLIHPLVGPVNAYRATRFASAKQRLMLSAEHPVCAWPDCNQPADEAQFHHLKRWEDGGLTNVRDMVPLCAYHNAVNDDDPLKPTGRGRMARIDGRVAWLPPWAGPPRFVPSPAHPPGSEPPDSGPPGSGPPEGGPPG